MRKPFLLFLFCIVIIGLLTYFIKNKRTVLAFDSVLQNRSIDAISKQEKLFVAPDAFRIEMGNQKLYAVTEKNIVVFNLKSNSKESTLDYPNLYNLFVNRDTLIAFNYAKNLLSYYIKGLPIKTENIKTDDNVLITSKEVFYGSNSSNQVSSYENIIRKSSSEFSFSITKAIDTMLRNTDSMCRLMYTDGRMMDLNENQIIFYPYHLSCFFVINKNTGSYTVKQTIEKIDRVEYKKIETNLPGIGKAFTCQPTNNISAIQRGAAVNANFLIMQSNIAVKEKEATYELLDFYDIKTMEYKFTRKFLMSEGGKDYSIDIKADNKLVYFLTAKGNIYTIKI